jgi:hypothetical protein
MRLSNLLYPLSVILVILLAIVLIRSRHQHEMKRVPLNNVKSIYLELCIQGTDTMQVKGDTGEHVPYR